MNRWIYAIVHTVPLVHVLSQERHEGGGLNIVWFLGCEFFSLTGKSKVDEEASVYSYKNTEYQSK